MIQVACSELAAIFIGKNKAQRPLKKITGLTSSHVLNVLVSFGADAQVHGFFYYYM